MGLDSRVASHFGRAPFYAVVNIDNGKVTFEIVENPRSQGMRPGEYALTIGVNGVVTKGDIGVRALNMLVQAGIEVYVAKGETLKDVIEEAKNKTLSKYTGTGCPGKRW